MALVLAVVGTLTGACLGQASDYLAPAHRVSTVGPWPASTGLPFDEYVAATTTRLECALRVARPDHRRERRGRAMRALSSGCLTARVGGRLTPPAGRVPRAGILSFTA
jgi:hypothetical protein